MDQNINQKHTPNKSPTMQPVHLTDYLNMIKRRKWIVIIFCLTVVSIVAMKSFNAIPLYRATTKIIIERRPSVVIKMENIMPVDARGEDFHQTQYHLLKSRSLARKVIKDLQLREYLAARRTMEKPGYLTIAMSKARNYLALAVNKTKGFFTSTSSIASEIPFRPFKIQSEASLLNKDPVINWYLFNLEIEPLRGSGLVNISFKGDSPEMSAQVVNTHAQAFIKRNIELRHSASQETLSWLKRRLEEQRKRVETSQRAIHEYKKANNIISLEERQNIVSQKLLELNSTLTRAKGDRLVKRATYNQLKEFITKKESLFSLPEIKKDSVITNLLNNMVQLKAKQLEMSTSYGPKHPRTIEINSGIKKLEDEIVAEVQRLKKVIKAELGRATALEKSIQRALNDQKNEILSLNEKAINYDVLRHEAETNQNIYDILLKQAKEISLTHDIESSNIRIVDEAEIPRSPYTPNISKNIIMAVIVSLFLGVGLAFFMEYMDDTVKTPLDLIHLGLPLLGWMPYEKSLNGSKITALSQVRASEKEEKNPALYYRYDISNRFPDYLQLNQRENSGNVIMIESATAGEGKTTVLSKSAINLARGGLRVVMVDTDLQRPALHHYFGTNNENKGGLSSAMKRVLSQEIQGGTLGRYSIGDLFFHIALKKLSGVLTIANGSQTIFNVFRNGTLLHLHSQNNPENGRLGNMLLHGGFITEDQLQDALERNQRTKQPLGYILVNLGYLTQDQLQGPLKLQTEEHLQRLFSWKKGAFVFKPGNIETYEDERIYFGEDYTTTIRRLGQLGGSRLLESILLSYIHPVNVPNLSLLPAGIASLIPNGPDYLTLLSKFLDLLKNRFDIVLVDAPPVLEVASASPLASLADGVILVAKAGHVSFKAINNATSSLRECNAKILGAVLNQVKKVETYAY